MKVLREDESYLLSYTSPVAYNPFAFLGLRNQYHKEQYDGSHQLFVHVHMHQEDQ